MINSHDNQRVKEVIKLHSRKHRKKTGKFIIEGKNIIEEAIEYGIDIEVYTTNSEIDGVLVSESVMKKMSDTETPQGLLGVASIPQNHFYEEQPVLVCESIQDPGNLGTMLRTALAFGYKNIILDSKSADVYSPKVVRSSKGAIFKLHIQIVENITDKIVELREKLDYTIIGTSLNGEFFSNDEATYQNKIALVFGNESNGLSDATKALCNKNIKIEISEVESLNVAVTAGILLYNFRAR